MILPIRKDFALAHNQHFEKGMQADDMASRYFRQNDLERE